MKLQTYYTSMIKVQHPSDSIKQKNTRSAWRCKVKKVAFLAFISLLLPLLVACKGTLEVGVEKTPTPRLESALGRLAYVQGGDIWVRDLDFPNSAPRRLTTDGRNSSPRWSPSGKWLSYHKEQALWVMRNDGSGAWSLVAPKYPIEAAWSPIGDRLAYITAQGGLFIVEADGMAKTMLIPDASPGQPEGVERFAWRPDGQWLACQIVQRADFSGEKPPIRQVLRIMKADGSESVDLYIEADPMETNIQLTGWSGDGLYILFWRGPASASLQADGVPLMSIPANGGKAQVIATEVVLTYFDFVAPQPLTSRLAVVVGSGRESWTQKRLLLVDANGQSPLLVDGGQAVAAPAWSPDGQQVAYVGILTKDGMAGGEEARKSLWERRIWLVGADGTGKRQLTYDPRYRDERPLWSADGECILFARIQDEGASLWLMDKDGSSLQQVVEELTPAPDWFSYYGYIQWEYLFDWWTGLTQISKMPIALPTCASPPTSSTPVVAYPSWKKYTSQVFRVSLQYPPGWQQIPGYEEKYGGEEGFFALSAIDGEGLTIDEVYQLESEHHLKPYGSQPDIERLQVQGQEARLIWPSEDQAKNMKGQTALIVQYPQPVEISGHVYRYFVLWADKDHMRQFTETLYFVLPAASESRLLYLQNGVLFKYDDNGEHLLAQLPEDADHLTLGPYYLAYTQGSQIKTLSLTEGTKHTLLDLGQRSGQDFNLCWSNDGLALAYTAAWDDPDGSRKVELGIIDGYEHRVVDILVAQPSGVRLPLTPTPPMPPEPGFANLRILVFDQAKGRLAVTQVGSQERYSSIWFYDLRTGRCVETIALATDIQEVGLSPDMTWLSLASVGKLQLCPLGTNAPPVEIELPANTHARWLAWSPSSQRLIYLLYEGATPSLDVSPSLSLWVWQVRTGQSHQLTTAVSPEGTLHGWTADEKAAILEMLDGISRKRVVSLVDVVTGQTTSFPLPEGSQPVGWIGNAYTIAGFD